MYIKSKRQTIIKKSQVDSSALGAGEFIKIDQGKKVLIESISDEKSQHQFIKMVSAIDGIKEGFIYVPHWEFVNPTPKGDVLLNVPFFSQLDNSTVYHGPGSRQCNLTSNAMAAEFILKDRSMQTLTAIASQKGFREPESAYGEIVNRYGDTTDHNANTSALSILGLESRWSTQLEIRDIVASIDKRLPVPIGMLYKSSGHIICAVGYNLDREIIYTHDPYGSRAGSQDYYAVIGNDAGKFDIYTFATMRKLWADPSDGWGRVFTAVGKVKTGL